MRAALALALAAASCNASEVDGHDLRGVFDAPSPSASTSASASASATATAKTDAGPRMPARVRTPISGRCVADGGEPAEAAQSPAKRPACRAARVIELRDEGRSPRYGCVFEPSNLASTKPVPLVVFLHGEHEDPTAVQKKTRLRVVNHKTDLSGDPRRPGFVILAPQARRLKSGVRWDHGHTAADNLDLQIIDQLVDQLVGEGTVDPRQIYAIGDSSGGAMAALWAASRPDRVAAFAAFGAAPKLSWSCEGEPTPAAILYRACDAVTSCSEVERWLSRRKDEGAPTFSLRLGVDHATEPSCATSDSACSEKKGTLHHARWPKSREGELLDYLGRYSLAAAERPR